MLSSPAATLPSLRRVAAIPTWRVLLLAGCLLLLPAQQVHYLNFTIDDAFISFRYARNLALGNGLVYNVGERVEGYSNFLWTVLMALPLRLGADRAEFGELVAAKILGGGLSLATLLLVWRAGLRYRVAGSAGPGIAWAAPAVLAASGSFAAWSVSGLETPLVTFLLTLAVYCLLRDERAPWWAGCLALAALTRPEPVLLFGVVLLSRVAGHLGRRRVRAPREDAAAAVAFALPYGAFLLWRLAYYGDLLPNTYYAKVGEVHSHALTALSGALYTLLGLCWLGLLAQVAVAVVPALARRTSAHYRLVSLLLAADLGAVVYDGGDWMPGFRFLVPALPLLALLFQDGCTTLRDAFKVRPATLALAVALACLATLAGSAATFRQALPGLTSGFVERSFGGSYYEMATWMRANVPSTDLVALGEAGIIPYYANVRVLDMFGLMDKHLAHLPGGHFDKFDAPYVLDRRPQYILLAHVVCRPDGTLDSIHMYARGLWATPRFNAEYVPVKRVVEDPVSGASLVLYQRRPDAP